MVGWIAWLELQDLYKPMGLEKLIIYHGLRTSWKVDSDSST
jgi:hypothetical protein